MDYSDYLENWELKFGDAETGEYDYWCEGKRHVAKVHRLNESEFNEHLKALHDASDAFDEGLKDDVGERMSKALRDETEHALMLLI